MAGTSNKTNVYVLAAQYKPIVNNIIPYIETGIGDFS